MKQIVQSFSIAYLLVVAGASDSSLITSEANGCDRSCAGSVSGLLLSREAPELIDHLIGTTKSLPIYK